MPDTAKSKGSRKQGDRIKRQSDTAERHANRVSPALRQPLKPPLGVAPFIAGALPILVPRRFPWGKHSLFQLSFTNRLFFGRSL